LYKLLLCWRYLLTRYLAMACIISVMLGVATLIVVNSVMSGFSTKLRERLHGLLSDVLIEAMSFDGFPDAENKIQFVRESPIGDKIAAMTPTLEILGIIQIRYNGQLVPRFVRIIGIDPEGRARVGGFAEHLMSPEKRSKPSFDLSPEAQARHDFRYPALPIYPAVAPTLPDEPPPPMPPPTQIKQSAGVILGYAIAHVRDPESTPENPLKDRTLVHLGDEVIITTISGQRLAPVYDSFVVCDYFKSEMSEYDANYVFVPLEHLQRLRTMEGRVTSIQIRLKNYEDAKGVVDVLKKIFPESGYKVETWEDKQGPLLAAIAVEKGILNVLLFLIIGVAGFGILAIFAMIVAEKTRDIGILKALGASNGGVMKIFLGYGLLLGVIGTILGTVLGLELTWHINDVEHFLGRLTGKEIFPRSIYYFDEIPTHIQAGMVMIVNLGAVAIAVLASVLPALRAALLHPVRALRYE
jgi:lipoprotein-releasing system permease protein